MKPKIQYNKTTVPTMMPASLRIATLFPACAARPRRAALPFKVVDMLEKTSLCHNTIRTRSYVFLASEMSGNVPSCR